jgi:retron-type reverse transcriptase
VGSFDRISHEWLLARIPMEKAILQRWLKAGFIEKDVLQAKEEGTPQGGMSKFGVKPIPTILNGKRTLKNGST